MAFLGSLCVSAESQGGGNRKGRQGKIWERDKGVESAEWGVEGRWL